MTAEAILEPQAARTRLSKLFAIVFSVCFVFPVCGETRFINKIDDWTTPQKFTGKYEISKEYSLNIKTVGQSLQVQVSDGSFLFSEDSVRATEPSTKNGVTVIPLFKEIHGGIRYYGLLVCKETDLGVLSKLVMFNKDGVDMKSGEHKYFPLSFGEINDSMELEMEGSKFDSERDLGVWKMVVDLKSLLKIKEESK